MNNQELVRFVQRCRQLFDTLDKKFRLDQNRPSGDKSESLLAAWARALRSVELREAERVLDLIFCGELKRPYDSDFCAFIRQESQRLKRQDSQGTGFLKAITADEIEMARVSEEMGRMRAIWGPVLDSLPDAERLRIAKTVLPGFFLDRYLADPYSQTFGRDEILLRLPEFLAMEAAA